MQWIVTYIREEWDGVTKGKFANWLVGLRNGLGTGIFKYFLSGFTTTVLMVGIHVAMAAGSSGVTNPLAGKAGNAGSMLNKVLSYLDDAILAVGGAWFLFSLYMAIIKFMSHSHQAQRREEAKTHLWHVAIAGVLLGAGGALAAGLYNFGGSL